MQPKFKRIFAWISLILLGLMYVSLLILALLGHGINSNLFGFCLLGTIAIPIFTWVIMWLINRAAGKIMPSDPVPTDSETKDN